MLLSFSIIFKRVQKQSENIPAQGPITLHNLMNSLICTIRIQNTKVITTEMQNSNHATINMINMIKVIIGNAKFK